MRRSIRYAVRFMAIVAVAVTLSLLLSPSGGAGSPYVSALSELAVGSLMAKPSPCNFSWCGTTGISCTKAKQVNCKVTGGVCSAVACN